MRTSKGRSRGFTLIAALLLLILLSGVAVGVMFMVHTNVRMGGNDMEQNLAYYGAESGIEKMTADLAALYQTQQAPPAAAIRNLTNFPPTSVPGMTYSEQITWTADANGDPVKSWNTISSGSNQGLVAEIVPLTLQANATRLSGASVNITRGVEVALIPVFQFGVFCGFDCSYFAGPNFSFGGRVHTNGNLFVGSGNGSNLVFNDKVAAFGQIVRDRLENNFLTNGNGLYQGTVWMPKASAGCPLNTFPPTGANCVALPNAIPGYASWYAGIPAVNGGVNNGFPSISSGTMNYYLTNSLTGATNMQLPFVQNSCTSNPPPCTDPIEIVRKPLQNELASSTIGQSRLYNKAQIRILIADSQADLHPERGAIADGQDVQLTGSVVTANGTEFFGIATPGANNWVAPLNYGGAPGSYPLMGAINPATGFPTGQGAWIRVEYRNDAGNWIGVTTQWLGYGFGRLYNTVPTIPGGNAATVNPNAIILLQQLRTAALTKANAFGAGTSGNWYPINFYDAREGQARDVQPASASQCSVNGIMSAVELDVGNLKRWLNGNFAGAGTSVNYTAQNGYVLYFSDRRGMRNDPNVAPGNATFGESGLEDTVNWASAAGTPDGQLETTGTGLPAMYYTYSPEDVNGNGQLDNWGGTNIGYGFGRNTNTAPPNPYLTIDPCNTTGLANAVTGARHVLKLVDAGLGNLPVRPDLPAPNQGGFTVASENPVYVQGNYNSSNADPFWGNNANNNVAHAAAAIIADSVTVLSNQWTDLNSLTNPTRPANRSAGAAGQDTYYRMAVAAGKNIPFQIPTWAPVGQDFGTDGGLHNFLRYLESWGNVNLWYNGSLVNLYYSEYDTGVFKCCNTVYSPPARKYYFDTLFLDPAKLPPGTPMFQDVVNLSYHQNFTPQ